MKKYTQKVYASVSPKKNRPTTAVRKVPSHRVENPEAYRSYSSLPKAADAGITSGRTLMERKYKEMGATIGSH